MKWFIFSAIIVLSLCSQYVPIPTYKHGLTIGNRSSNLQIHAFYDLLCSDSKEVDQVLENVVNVIGLDGFKLTYVFVPLPYHLYSFKIHQLYQYILDNQGQDLALEYINYVLRNQEHFMESKWRNYKITEFQYVLAKAVSNHLNLNVNQLINALKPGNSYDLKTRAEWKYAIGSLSVSGTPIFFANGVKIDGAEQWSEQQWIQFIARYSD